MIEWITFACEAIKNFPMGDPHERSFPVYLPPDYRGKGDGPYPVVFFLAGFSGKGSAYLADDSAFGVPLQTRFDRAIRAGRMKPFIGVFPDGTSKLGCSQYVNSPAFGNYTDYFADELPKLIDEKYATHRAREFRAVVGHSSGGFGALVIGMQRPDAFAYVLSSAGDGFYEVSLLRNINVVMIELEKFGSVAAFLKNFLEHPNPKGLSAGEFDTMLTLAMAPCYAPNLANPPLYGDLFFDLKTGTVIPEIWEKYLAWDPVRMVDRFAENLKQLKYIRLEAGLQDEHALQWGHRQLAEKFKRHGISYEIEEYPGRHGGHHWRFEPRITRILDHMGK